MTFNLFKGLLPRAAKAWNITVDKRLRQFFQGLSAGAADPVVEEFDGVWDDFDPQTTTKLLEWEDQFNLPLGTLTEQERRDRLEGAWSAVGGQDPRYIEDTFRNAGFDVYVHQWWVPGTEPPVGVQGQAVPRNPQILLGTIIAGIECGEVLAECGEPEAECGNTFVPAGYALVNGSNLEEAGIIYTVPSDPALWPFFFYVGGQSFPDQAQVPQSRRAEFEELILKIKPRHLWVGVLVEYV